MRFYDTVTIKIKSGAGGNGCVSARREAGVPYGGPAGGNGGVGGSVIFHANAHITTLADFRPSKLYQAHDGMPGRTKEQDGKNAEDLILEVPVGTLIINRQTQVILGQLTVHGQEYVIAHGGKCGIGNMHFKSSTRQYPNFALKGEPGIMMEVKLELQLIADVALIGSPSVGKSSIINTLARTRAKVADYPFTTLVPNLGTIQAEGRHYHVIDIPGLIVGAHEGKGLGNLFLRHILKAHIIAVVLDISRFDYGIQEFAQTMDELISYIQERYHHSTEFGMEIGQVAIKILVDDYIRLQVWVDIAGVVQELLFEKIIQIIVNKTDLVSDEEIIQEYRQALIAHISTYLHRYSVHKITDRKITTHIVRVNTMLEAGADVLKKIWSDIIGDEHIQKTYYIDQIIGQHHPHTLESIQDITDTEMPLLIGQGYLQETQAKHSKVRAIVHPEICRLSYILPRGNEQAEERFWKQCMRQKLNNRWNKHGVMTGDIFKIISLYPGTDDMYITYE